MDCRFKKSIIGCWLLCLCFFTVIEGTAQDQPAPEKNLLPNEAPSLRFEHLKIEDGMAQGSANHIYQDSQGYMWITTQSGLHRYDGYEFKVYNYTAYDTTSLSDGWTWAVSESKDGNLWVTTEFGGVNKLDKATGTFINYMHDPNDSTSISTNRTFFPFEDSRGDLWVTTGNDGLNRMKAGQDGIFIRYRHIHDDSTTLSSRNTFYVSEDLNGDIWVSSSNGISRIDPETEEIKRFLFDPDGSGRYGAPYNVLSQYHPPNEPDIIWLATGNGLVRLNTSTEELERYLIEPNSEDVNPINFIQQIVLDPDLPNVFWVSGPNSGVARFDTRTNEFTSYRHKPTDPNSLSEDYVQTLFADRSGTVWVGYTAEGISAFNPGAVNFSHLRHDPEDPLSLSPGLVWGVYEDKKGSLWIGTDDGPNENYLTHFDAETGQTIRYQFDRDDPETILPGNIRAFAEDEKDNFWVAGNVGLNKLDRSTGKVTRLRLPDVGAPNNIFKIEKTKNDAGAYWIGSVAGVDLYDGSTGTRTTIPLNLKEEDQFPLVLAIHEDPENQLIWLGTRIGLIRHNQKDSTSTIFKYNPRDTTSISDDVIFEIVERDEEPGIFWLATQSSGLNRFDTKTEKSTHFTKEDGLPDNHIYGILEDESGTLWMSTNNGITNFNPDNKTFRNYGLDDGLIALEYNQNAYFKGQGGVMYFGSSKGVTAFVPEQLKTNEIPPQVLISDFKLFNKSVPVGPQSILTKPISEIDKITLKHRQNEVTFEFVALHFANPEKNKYQYQLVGFDKNWVQTDGERSATYTNLAPGNYTFNVMGANSDGVWNEEASSVDLTVLPPWYQTWWAYSLFVCCIGFIVFGVDRTQRWRLRKKEQERTALREAEFRAEAENKRRADTEQLSKIGRTITSTLSVDEIIETVYEHVNALMDAEIFSVGIYNKHKDTLDFPATKEKGKMLSSYSYNLDEDGRLAVWCFKNKKEIIIGDFEKEYNKYINDYKQPLEGEISSSIIYLPLVQQGRVIGVVTTQSFKKNAYTEYHINLLRNLATYAAIAIDNASAYRQLNSTLSELKSTQNQLVQQEKLASLGQLTAGIAHEIKNPLNFVNNFSDLNVELIEEAREVAGDNADLIEILNDIEANLNKIHEHGSRADSIVKSMLLHSRGGSGKKEKTDINQLIKEYFNLAFHGMRAGKNPINVDIDFKLDDNLKEVKMIREDFSRVILNLCNNAFDAMRGKLDGGGVIEGEKYTPKLSVQTDMNGNEVTICIEDNGPGIPEDLKDKIMQPFFTTKKGTEGTGLGLSITNDIIKAHGGTLTIESETGRFTRFIIKLAI